MESKLTAQTMLSLATGFLGGLAGALVISLWRAPAPVTANPGGVPFVVTSNTPLANGGQIPSVFHNCELELRKFCAQVSPGHGALKSCLLDHRRELSASCLKTAEDFNSPQ